MLKRIVLSAPFLLFMVGCFDQGGSTGSSAPAQSQTPSAVRAVSSLGQGQVCNNGQEGSLVYDISQSAFFACINSQWTTVNLQGPPGPTGASGAAGTPGSQGTQGTPGSNGASGTGVGGLALKDGAQTMAYLIQYGTDSNANDSQSALIMLPNQDITYIDVPSGQYKGSCSLVYYTGANCTGNAYMREDSRGPHVLNRIYVGRDNSFNPIRYFHADQYLNPGVTFASPSYRDYCTSGQMDQCKTYNSTIAKTLSPVQVSEMATPPTSLQYLAPIQFVPQ